LSIDLQKLYYINVMMFVRSSN